MKFRSVFAYTICMCQSLADGGRRCPAHQPATLGTKSYCKELFSLHTGQIDHTFRRLRMQGSNRPAPTQEEYQAFVDKMKQVTARNVNRDSTARRINNHLNKTLEDHQLPDGPTFYALKKLVARSRDQKRNFVQAMREYAQNNDTTRTVAYERFEALYNEAPTSSLTNSWNDDFDAATRYSLSQMNNEPISSRPIAEEPRIQRQALENRDVSYGYDPDDGRLEIELPSGTYAFRNVPLEVAQGVEDDPMGTLRNLRDNGLYAYDSSEEAALDAYGRYCHDCHKYKAMSGHVCDPEDLTSVTMEETEEDVRTTPTSSEDESLSLSAAQARIRKSLEEAEQNGNTVEIPTRPRVRMTARRRLWASPIEDREEVRLDNTERASGAGSRPYSTPSPSLVKEKAMRGEVVHVRLDRHGHSPSYARDYGGTAEVTMSHDLKFYCDDVTGDVKMQLIGDPRCDCEEYRSNGRCRHTHSQSDMSRMNNYLKHDINNFHKRVDPQAHMRSEAMAGTLYLTPEQNRSVTIEGTNHYITTPPIRAMRNAQRALESGGKVQIVRDDNSIVLNNNRLTGELSFETNENDYGVSILNTLKCRSCGEEEPCAHGVLAQKYFEEKVLPSNSVVTNAGSRLTVLDRIEENDWQSNPEDVQHVLQTFSTGVDRSYTANLDDYIADYRAARDKAARGEEPLPYATENVTNGVCAPGQKAFGIEIEFDIARGHYQHDVTERVGRRMYDLGLTETPSMMGWHHAARTATPYSAWSLEYDSTVAAEIVSPILHDTPETWEHIQKIYQILQEEGAEGTSRCGLHVHMGTINREQSRRRADRTSLYRKNANILHFYSANEDSIRRVQTDPYRKSHRNSSYAPAMDRNSIQSSLYNLNAGYNLGIDHRTSVNLGYSDRIEFRGADGTMSAAHTQAQVMMNAAIVSAAERGDLPAGDEYENLKHQRVGTNARRLEAIRSLTPDAEELTDDQLIVSDASYRNFITSLFDTDHGRKMMVGIAAMSPWQR